MTRFYGRKTELWVVCCVWAVLFCGRIAIAVPRKGKFYAEKMEIKVGESLTF